jgi:SAM-dependent methyltransferase
MSESLPEIPKQWIKGLVPTMNDKGFMFEVLDEYADEFIRVAGASTEPALEVGCAYGVASLAALQAGATITACDMDERHLQILKSRAPKDSLERLTIQQGTLPDIDLPEGHFGTLLCSRVLHFLPGIAIDKSVRNMYHWLKPGGRLFLVADTPWGIWRNFIPTWDKNRECGHRWPGYMPRPVNYLPYAPSADDIGPELMNLLDPELLVRTCEEAGFEVTRSGFIDRSDFGGDGSMDGRENCGVAAVKPA